MTKAPSWRIIAIMSAVIAGALQGCVTVQPWERDRLAQPAMALDADAITDGLDAHIYFSKESASGGRGFGGGGCGCN